jgi:hypothetical protein
MFNEQFFKVIRQYMDPNQPYPFNFLTNINKLDAALQQINHSKIGNYLYEKFIFWLSHYFQEIKTQEYLQSYFSLENSLNFICIHFINYCFDHKIKLDPEKTLQSFSIHNQLSDKAVKKELLKITKKSHINLLGFGLDDGIYEKELANFLVLHKVCNTITIYGMDPYAIKSNEIQYITPEQLSVDSLKFDVIIARWSLHHVKLSKRWSDLSACISHSNSDASIIFIEHGFLQNSQFTAEKKLYKLLNALFDIIANIGLRPTYFTNTAPSFGEHFFIHYLEMNDFSSILKNSSANISYQNIYDVGPNFPNQTICCFRTALHKNI